MAVLINIVCETGRRMIGLTASVAMHCQPPPRVIASYLAMTGWRNGASENKKSLPINREALNIM